MAFDAVSSLLFAIHGLIDSPRISVVSSSTLQSLLCGYHQAQQLQTTLNSCSQVATASDEKLIIAEARMLEATIEFPVSTQFLEQAKSCKPPFSLHLDHLKKHVDRFSTVAEKMRRRIEELWEQKVRKMIEEDVVEICVPLEKEEAYVSSSATDMVGLGDEFNRVRNTFTRTPGVRINCFWISGMAGIGKTTFVERIYHDPLVKATFKYRAFVRVGREYRVERVFRAITTQLNHGDEKMMKGRDNMDIYENFYRTLSVKRCLVVLDDVWDDVAENLVERILSSEYRGSWILFTSRMERRIPYLFHCLKMRLLNEEESWELLKRKVFCEEDEVCPPLLVEPGKKIAKRCEGLPLLIIAVADQLRSKVQKNQESWNRVAEKPNSVLEEASQQISEILITSYNHIDERYKLCFLYLAAFPQSHVIFCSMINNLWHAEGFCQLWLAERFCHYLTRCVLNNDKSHAFRELRRKNLVITDHQRIWSCSQIKACRLHCAYWYLCKKVAKDNWFLYILNSFADGTDERVKSHHRLAFQTTVLLAIKEVGDIIASILTVRSLLCTGPYHQYQVPIVCSEWKLLRVLDALSIRFYEFPVEVVNLILLRYLSLTCNANLPPSISKLWRLQFLIVHQHYRIRRVATGADESYVPVEIWDLQELIHLEITGRNLPHPPHPGVVLPNLQKLLDVGVESCAKGVLGNIPNLRKVRIQTELAPDAAETLICSFSNIESFQCVVLNPTLLPPPPLQYSTPINGLVKLSLSGCGYPWEEMSKIGKIGTLGVLKLRCYAFRGEKWESNGETEFCLLQFLYIEDTDLVQWRDVSGNINMPFLQRLTMKNCYKLHEIPRFSRSDLKIELVDCNPLAETWAKQSCHTGTEVTASYSLVETWAKKSNRSDKKVSASYSWKKKST